MIVIQLTPSAAAPSPKRWLHYRIADRSLLLDRALPELAPFLAGRMKFSSNLATDKAVPSVSNTAPLYSGPGWIGNQWRTVRCWQLPGGFFLDIELVGRFAIMDSGRRVVCLSTHAAIASHVHEAVLGPVLILALALADVWSLHGSAARWQGSTAIFVGESGRGKSTLAAFLGREAAPDWTQIADDTLPVHMSRTGLLALPYYPQLKLAAESQPAIGVDERLAVRCIYLIAATPEVGTEPAIQPLSSSEAAIALVRHTVAARLFDPSLLARHLDFCASLAERVPVRRLSYPHQLNLLPSVGYTIEADLASF